MVCYTFASLKEMWSSSSSSKKRNEFMYASICVGKAGEERGMLIFILQAGDKNGKITSFLQKAAVVAVRVSPARAGGERRRGVQPWHAPRARGTAARKPGPRVCALSAALQPG